MTKLEELRRLIGDPEGVRFDDATLQFYLDQNRGNLYKTAAFVWGLIAVEAYNKLSVSGMTRMSVGGETYEYRSLEEDYKLALEMQDRYTNLADAGTISSVRITKMSPPRLFKDIGL